MFTRKIVKRSLKNFTTEKWNECLIAKDWSKLETSELNEMVEIFTKNTQDALDEVAPFKSSTVKSQYKFGLSEETKLLMSKRDSVRESISKASNPVKQILLKKYKALRNTVTSRIRKESVEYNNSRILAAKDENEITCINFTFIPISNSNFSHS